MTIQLYVASLETLNKLANRLRPFWKMPWYSKHAFWNHGGQGL